MSNKITKKNYNDYQRSANIHNTLSHQVADLQAHIQFLTRTGDLTGLEDLSTSIDGFLDVITSNYVEKLSDDE